jgi:hypothetical protein
MSAASGGSYTYDDYLEGCEDEREYLATFDYPVCGCHFCFCTNQTECGEACSDCLSGAHQG